MLSLASHLADPGRGHIHVLAEGADLRRAGVLVECFRRELRALPSLPRVWLHALEPLLVDVGGPGLPAHDSRPDLRRPQTFARLYLHRYLSNVSRVIWLDHDTIVRHDLGVLYRMQMRGLVAAA